MEAIYTFPLSDRAAVDGMTMQTGARVIRGEIKRREGLQNIKLVAAKWKSVCPQIVQKPAGHQVRTAIIFP